jgi:cation transport regulator ChaB
MNIAGQIGADETPIEDISDINALSVALAGGLGALGSNQLGSQGTAQGVSGANKAAFTQPGAYGEAAAPITGADYFPELGSTGDFIKAAATPESSSVSFLEGLRNVGESGLDLASDYVQGNRATLASAGASPGDFMNLKGITDIASALGPTISQGTGDVFREAAIDYRDEADRLRAEEEAEWEATEVASDSKRAEYQMTFMRQAGIGEDEIKETLDSNELGDYYEPPVEAAQGGIIGLKNGGMLNFGGREMDLRTGGFVPIGRKERADDVPARLSKNEFVMTADAVRAAGGGSVNKGAQRMYDVMNKLEARA